MKTKLLIAALACVLLSAAALLYLFVPRSAVPTTGPALMDLRFQNTGSIKYSEVELTVGSSVISAGYLIPRAQKTFRMMSMPDNQDGLVSWTLPDGNKRSATIPKSQFVFDRTTKIMVIDVLPDTIAVAHEPNPSR
ncbi:MAG TPA: hypothetical protein VF777_05765 [Phycisphaerales bacterium]